MVSIVSNHVLWMKTVDLLGLAVILYGDGTAGLTHFSMKLDLIVEGLMKVIQRADLGLGGGSQVLITIIQLSG